MVLAGFSVSLAGFAFSVGAAFTAAVDEEDEGFSSPVVAFTEGLLLLTLSLCLLPASTPCSFALFVVVVVVVVAVLLLLLLLLLAVVVALLSLLLLPFLLPFLLLFVVVCRFSPSSLASFLRVSAFARACFAVTGCCFVFIIGCSCCCSCGSSCGDCGGDCGGGCCFCCFCGCCSLDGFLLCLLEEVFGCFVCGGAAVGEG